MFESNNNNNIYIYIYIYLCNGVWGGIVIKWKLDYEIIIIIIIGSCISLI